MKDSERGRGTELKEETDSFPTPTHFSSALTRASNSNKNEEGSETEAEEEEAKGAEEEAKSENTEGERKS